jgi:GTPase Era involved in 16S rRNA processing
MVGFPNAGKSELVNRLMGKKVSAVSSKRNTTVDVALGSFTQGGTQVGGGRGGG